MTDKVKEEKTETLIPEPVVHVKTEEKTVTKRTKGPQHNAIKEKIFLTLISNYSPKHNDVESMRRFAHELIAAADFYAGEYMEKLGVD